MNSYISLLRGINVSGQKKVPMAELRALYESLGLEAVQSYMGVSINAQSAHWNAEGNRQEVTRRR